MFPFRFPGNLFLGPGAVEKVGEESRRLGAGRALIVCDAGIVAAQLDRGVRATLEREGITYELCPEAQPEPPVKSVDAVAEVARTGEFDLVIGLGGGSAMDTAKLSAALAGQEGSVADFFGINLLPRKGLPTIMIPTTAGTGSEATANAVFVAEDQNKKAVISPLLMPDSALVDPLLTLTAPPSLTAATGLDALTHAMESYTAVKATPHTRLYALEAIRLIGLHLRTAVWNGSDLEARAGMTRASFYAGVSLNNAGVNAVHALAHTLGGFFHVPHGVANALLLPHVMAFNMVSHLARFAEMACALGERVEGLSMRAAAERCVEAVRQLSLDVGIPQTMREVGVSQEDIPRLSQTAAKVTRLLKNNPRHMTVEDVEYIYRQAY